MTPVLVDVDNPIGCEPITSTRSLGQSRVVNRALEEVQKEFLDTAAEVESEDSLCMRADSWCTLEDLRRIAVSPGESILETEDGDILAWKGTESPSKTAEKCSASDKSFRIHYCWQLLTINEQLLSEIKENKIEGELSERAEIDGVLVLGEGSRVLPGVYIEGTVVIGKNCKVGPNCYIRGNTSIGDNCHVGQAVEIKNSILMNKASIGHLSYTGDSVIGERVNFGAGTITANLRHDGKNHRSAVEGKLVETGRRKFGTIAGDDVHTGIHTSIYPGRKFWPGTSSRPGDTVSTDIK